MGVRLYGGRCDRVLERLQGQAVGGERFVRVAAGSAGRVRGDVVSEHGAARYEHLNGHRVRGHHRDLFRRGVHHPLHRQNRAARHAGARTEGREARSGVRDVPPSAILRMSRVPGRSRVRFARARSLKAAETGPKTAHLAKGWAVFSYPWYLFLHDSW